MYQSKSRHKQFHVDMFPMLNLLLIILLFFVISGKPITRCPININLPEAHYFNTADPDGENITILEAGGKTMLQLESEDIRKGALMLMQDIYHIPFTNSELTKFSKTDVIGVSMSELKSYITSYYNPQSYYSQKGIPMDSDNQLFNWIRCSRKATVNLHNTQARIVIEAEGDTKYPVIKKIFSLLKKQHIYRFLIIYSYVKDKNEF